MSLFEMQPDGGFKPETAEVITHLIHSITKSNHELAQM
jgi:hypothetical protein